MGEVGGVVEARSRLARPPTSPAVDR